MKVTYEFDLGNEDEPRKTKVKEKDDEGNVKHYNNDFYDFVIYQRANDLYMAMTELDNVRRNLNKGYVYYAEKQPQQEENSPYSLINVDKLVDDISEILSDSRVHEIP